jgi:hypothetical protein
MRLSDVGGRGRCDTASVASTSRNQFERLSFFASMS